MAKNYNRDATQDDGSCEFYYSNIKGCTNPLAKTMIEMQLKMMDPAFSKMNLK